VSRPAADEVLDYVVSFVGEHGYAPTVREIGRAFAVHSTSVIASILDQLHDQGVIRRAPGVARGIEVVGHSARRGDLVVIRTDQGLHYEGRLVAVAARHSQSM